MRDGQAAQSAIRLADYRPPAFLVDQVTLDVDLRETGTRVSASLTLRRNPAPEAEQGDCVLDGVALTPERIAVNGEQLADDRWHYDGRHLTLRALPDQCTLDTVVTIAPETNTALEGLYVSKGMFCTQCEAEGFRRITFFPDRPDVLSRFVTTVRADKAAFPVLLSNGNPVARGDEGSDRHWVRWEDPFPKPCYLFALVAGDLACLDDVYRTGSGRDISLQIYAEPRDLNKLDHAMASLKAAMAWDEKTYGLEYDLDIYMIVAVSHFNMGAMENKGLNIFNTACVLAHPATTTDAGFQRVEAVVAHEYFHNWSGNRVTCRDWFQLSLKEGFTVFRDQTFSGDMNSATVKRVEDVDMLRAVQFAEDRGPMAHPVRPAEYQKIDNFYTVTIYEKGAELVRMQHELLGPEAFRRGTDLYFSRFDGQAVTTDDFVDCMEQAGGQDLSQFRRWYSQAGTPQLTVQDSYDGTTYTLTLKQSTPATPGQPEKLPLLVPVAMALLGADGQPLPLSADGQTETVLQLTEAQQQVSFEVPERPVPSLLRGFSAPVELNYDYSTEQLRFLLAHDTDGYCRWDAAQRLYHGAVQRLLDEPRQAEAEAAALVPALEQVLARAADDPAATALLLTIPGEVALADRLPVLDVDGVHEARAALVSALGRQLAAQWWVQVEANETSGPYRPAADDIGRRSLRHRALGYLAAAGDKQMADFLGDLCRNADNMTDELGALRLLCHYRLAGSEAALAAFAERWRDEALVMDQWFAVQASVPGAATLSRVEALLAHDDFDWRVPNRVRGLLGTFAGANPTALHAADGKGYELYTQCLARLDTVNPQVAARMANACARLPRLPVPRQTLLAQALEQLLAGTVSDNLREVLERILASRD
ncbi:aminopeptidase N [Alcanivorax sp. JB21]|uniref:aminopeptidase N n=1 Tax=Alcanivorax limicola TaxID=2874102 RepID=UPI001CBECD06|nr:aminopeptidase N [Alcanivorax limicola]MBZ2188075.1 aminopeptidase N [Alcanivorax limicola]